MTNEQRKLLDRRNADALRCLKDADLFHLAEVKARKYQLNTSPFIAAARRAKRAAKTIASQMENLPGYAEWFADAMGEILSWSDTGD